MNHADEFGRPAVIPASGVAFHGTKAASVVSAEGLRVAACRMACKHVCLSPTPELAAAFALGPDAAVLVVDIRGLGIEEFIGDEARTHTDIPPSRLLTFTDPVVPSLGGHVDPARAYPPVNNHPHCWPFSELGRDALRRGIDWRKA